MFSVKIITFYYKQDVLGNLWFLWASSMIYDQDVKQVYDNMNFEKKIKVPKF